MWNYKILGRYIMPWDIGVSGSYKLQSGRQWGRSAAVTLPVAGSETIRMEPVTANRAPNVSILDFRFDKAFRFGRFGRLTGMVDIFNLFNDGHRVTTFRTATGATFLRGHLAPRPAHRSLRRCGTTSNTRAFGADGARNSRKAAEPTATRAGWQTPGPSLLDRFAAAGLTGDSALRPRRPRLRLASSFDSPTSARDGVGSADRFDAAPTR